MIMDSVERITVAVDGFCTIIHKPINRCWSCWELVRQNVKFFLFYKDYLNAFSDCRNTQMGYDPYLKFLLFLFIFLL